MKMNREEFIKQSTIFSSKLQEQMKLKMLDFQELQIDHVCFRCASLVDYDEMSDFLLKNGELLIKSKVNSREISTFKLNEPLNILGQKVYILELPSVKNGSPYPNGFEHVEYVIKESFNSFMKKNSKIKFNTSNIGANINPDIKLKFGDEVCIKFHHQSLFDIIQKELEVLHS